MITPFMQKNEIELYSKYLKKAKNLFEFGAGNSTLYAETFSNIENIYSIDNDKKWCDHIRSTSSTNKINITHIDTGPLHPSFGIPLNDTKFDDGDSLKQLQPNYYNFIHNIDIDIDTILIDGRWRVMCGIKTWEKFKEKDVTVIIHDYLDRKHMYGFLDNYYEIIESVGSLVVTKPKKENIELDYSKYLFDWS
jgi:hypothetical protein